MTPLLLLLSILAGAPSVLGFLPSWVPGAAVSSPDLQTYSQAQTDTLLDIRLSVGVTSDSVFVIDGFQFQLGNAPLAKEECVVPLPGAHGPSPRLSSGAHQLQITHDGSFINMDGTQSVAFREGAWEMIWREHSSAGLIICGLNLEKDARRNDLCLEKGQIYLTWPVWSKDGLAERRATKAEAEEKYKAFEAERDSSIEKMGETPNLLMKALHFRNAAAATEKMDYTGLHNMMDTPTDEDVLEIGEGLQMVRVGTVWTKNGESFGSSFRARRQQLLGSATLL
ncbi:hypothetical protein ACHAXT_008442 [Thalassiosira profunda]